MSVSFGSGRCECGCGEGIHMVAAMAGSKCCDKCTGWKAAPVAPEPAKKPRKAWAIRVTRPDGTKKWRARISILVEDDGRETSTRTVLRWPSRSLAERAAAKLRDQFPRFTYEVALHDGTEASNAAD